ncbi:MAG TPA: hypothetical protein VGC16_09280 [Rhizomicrobium sp.]
MQVSATLIAAQAAAREARARLQVPQAPQQANFASALEKTAGTQDSFAPLPLKQTAPTQAAAAPQAQPGARLGQHLDITV